MAAPLMAVAATGSDADGAPIELTERLLGHHPQTGEPVYARIGPYGLYVQQGDTPPKPAAGKKKKAKGAATEEAAAKPRRAQAPKVRCACACARTSPCVWILDAT
jgi:topoisomerase IA-like protein